MHDRPLTRPILNRASELEVPRARLQKWQNRIAESAEEVEWPESGRNRDGEDAAPAGSELEQEHDGLCTRHETARPAHHGLWAIPELPRRGRESKDPQRHVGHGGRDLLYRICWF